MSVEEKDTKNDVIPSDNENNTEYQEETHSTSEQTIDNEKLIRNLKDQQNFGFAFIGGLLAAVISAVLWAAITVAAKYQIGYMAIAVGFLVGFSVRFFGAGIDRKFGILGAILSLLGCLLGNLFSQVGFIAEEYSYSYLEVFSLLNFQLIIDILIESFSPMDILFYGIAIYEGYKFSFRNVTAELIRGEENSLAFKWRMPLAIAAAVILVFAYFKVTQGYSGMKSYTYDSGETMSEGELKDGKYEGPWTFYYENGNILSEGYFHKDIRDKDWKWYNEEGVLEKTGSYKNGVEDNIWINYYGNGNIIDSVAYSNGRRNGKYIARYENGNLYMEGDYKIDRRNGLWKTFYDNGQLWSEGEIKDDEYIDKWITYYDNGKIAEELFYGPGNTFQIKNRWETDGTQTITNGSGFYNSYSDTGILLTSGEIKNGEKVGLWKTFRADGNLDEEGIYENNIYKTINAWNTNGEQTVKEGTGTYASYWEDVLILTGEIVGGLKEGLWKTYYSNGELMNETIFLNGKMNGKHKMYYDSGLLSFEGEFINDLKTGKWKWYNENGTLSSIAEFINDKKEGIQTINDMSGKTVRKEKYKAGELIKVDLVY